MPNSQRSLRLTGHFDGGNPRHSSHIRQEQERVYHVKPEWEGGPDKCTGRCFAVMIENAGIGEIPLTVKVDWGTDRHMRYKSVYYYSEEGEPDWEEVAARVSGAVAEVQFGARPGVSWLSLTPMYNYSRYLAFIDALREREEADVRLAGKSAEGREIWRVQVPPGAARQAEPVVFIARTWGCETAGNYMIEGMIRFLFSEEPEALQLLRDFTFHFIPMVNPDGVYNGLERHPSNTSPVDLENMGDDSDPAHAVLLKTLTRLKPRLFINLHDWLPPDRDGLICSDEFYALRLPELLPAIGELPCDHSNEWYSDGVEAPVEREGVTVRPVDDLEYDCSSSWREFCRSNFGSQSLTVELPWRGRSVEDMRQLGIALLKGVCLVRLQERLESPGRGTQRE